MMISHGDGIRDVNWALWHVDFQTEIGLQTFMIKGHVVINTLDTSSLPTQLDTQVRTIGVT